MLELAVVSDLGNLEKPIDDIYQGENKIYQIIINGFGNLHTADYNLWVIYELPSGTVHVSDKIPIGADRTDKIVTITDGVLAEEGILKIQAVISTGNNIFNIAEDYVSGDCDYPIYKSRVYEFFVNDSIDVIKEILPSESTISQEARDYLRYVANQIIAEELQFDSALSDTSVNAVQNKTLKAVLAEKSDTNHTHDDRYASKVNPKTTGTFSHNRKTDSPVGTGSVALGSSCTASGYYSIAIGNETTASGPSSYAEGSGSVASGGTSHAEGQQTIAAGSEQHVEGRLNISDPNSEYIHIAGNGSLSNGRSNAHTLDWSGNAWFAGDVKTGGANYNDGDKLATENYVDSSSSEVLDESMEAVGTLLRAMASVNIAADAASEPSATHSYATPLGVKTYVETGLSNKSDLSHTHDDRYYTETEVDAFLTDKADVTAIPSVPTISLNIAEDAASDDKTASPKAVKAYVDAAITSAVLYESDVSLTEFSQGGFVFDADDNPIVAYRDDSLQIISRNLLTAITNGGNMTINGYPLIKSDFYDPEHSSTLLGYWLTYNATAISPIQWKKIDNSKPIVLFYVELSNYSAALFTSEELIAITHILVKCQGTLALAEIIPIVPDIATDILVDAASDDKTVSPKAVKRYVDAAISAAITSAIGGSY